NPEVLILDEPTSGLDPIQRAEVRRLVADLSSEHTVLLSSHILAEIEAMAPRVVIIHEGQKVADGNQAQIIESLGGDRGHVLVEAAAPAEPEAMAELLKSLPGVASVDVGARVGIHQSFAIAGEGDLREDVGALAMTQGWALRELTWKRPTLEQIFTRLVVGDIVGGSAAPAADSGGGSDEGAGAAPAPGAPLDLAPISPPAAPAPSADDSAPLPLGTPGTAKSKTIYSLNPFDRGASRDLSKPVSIEPDAPVELEGPEGDA
ncbi:MAG: hypothetical protein AAGG01_21430, partial [Planctomycetota bacterium]